MFLPKQSGFQEYKIIFDVGSRDNNYNKTSLAANAC